MFKRPRGAHFFPIQFSHIILKNWMFIYPEISIANSIHLWIRMENLRSFLNLREISVLYVVGLLKHENIEFLLNLILFLTGIQCRMTFGL